MRDTGIIEWLFAAVILAGYTVAAKPPVDNPAFTNEAVAGPTTMSVPSPTSEKSTPALAPTILPTAPSTATRWSSDPHPLQIEAMRQQTYPGSVLTVEQSLAPGANYDQYVVSYQSDGNKIYALMTIPHGTKPDQGWPVIVFNHGYIPPAEYRTTERYTAYVDTIARHGYIVFKPDYRGFGNSAGGSVVGGGYGTPGYTVEVLNAITSLKANENADPNRIGIWGHSMGGQIALRAMVVSQDIKAGVIWGGVVAPYPDIIALWDFTKNASLFPGLVSSEISAPQSSTVSWLRDFSGWVKEFTTTYGTPDQNPDFWASISPNTYLADLSGPIQLHHSTTDEMVPLAWSETLAEELQTVGKQPYELYTYPGDNHNITANFGDAMQRTIGFFDKYVKDNSSLPIDKD